MSRKTKERNWLQQYYTEEKIETEAYYDTFDDFRSTAELDAYEGDLSLIPADKYQVTGSIGQGGGKTIITIKDRDTTRHLAMAIIRDEDRASPDKIKRFIREARITASLEHPNIVPVHDIGIDDEGKPYFTMKLIEGEDLYEVVRRLDQGKAAYQRKYTLPYLLSMFEAICNAIAYAHARGIIHLDLKPSNIRISDYGEILVVDWGLARFIEDANEEEDFENLVLDDIEDTTIEITRDGVIKGSPGFMAPEQALGSGYKDQRTDIYSLGAILYSILTYKRPIHGNNVRKVLEDTRNGNIIPPKKRTPKNNIPSALDAICMKAMSTNPRFRYNSVNELTDDIKKFTHGYATSVEDSSILTLLWLMYKRHKIFVPVVTIMILAIVLLSIMAVNKARIADDQRAIAENLLVSTKEQHNSLIKKEKEIENVVIPSLREDIQQKIKLNKLPEALLNTERVLELRPNNKDYKILKTYLLTSLFRLKEAHMTLLEIELKSSNELKPLLETLGEYKYTKKWSNDKFIGFIKSLNSSPHLSSNLLSKERFMELLSIYRHTRITFTKNELGPYVKHLLKAGNNLKLNSPIDIATVENIPRLKSIKLVITDPSIQSIAVLAGLNISELNLANSNVFNFSIIKKIKGLRKLNLQNTSIKDLSVINTLFLTDLNLVGCDVDFKELKIYKKSKLKKLYVSHDAKNIKLLNLQQKKINLIREKN